MKTAAAFLMTLAMLLPLTAQAQSTPAPMPSLPVEIKMLYLKLLARTPDYDAMISENPSFKANPSLLSNNAVMTQQRDMLRSLYDKAGTSTPIILRKDLQITQSDIAQRLVTLAPIAADDPVIYRVATNETYAVFIRNTQDLVKLSPPYEFDDLSVLIRYPAPTVKTTLTVTPLAADPEDYVLPSGEKVHVILGKVTALVIDQPHSDQLLLDKRLDAASPMPFTPPVLNETGDGKALPPATVTQ